MRIGSSGFTTSGLTYCAFENPDGSYALLALNRNAKEVTIAVQGPSKGFRYTIPANSIASFRWSETEK